MGAEPEGVGAATGVNCGTAVSHRLRDYAARQGFGRVPEDKAGFQPDAGNPPYGTNGGVEGNVGRIPGLFATLLERADTKEAIGLNRSGLRSPRPVRSAVIARGTLIVLAKKAGRKCRVAFREPGC